MKRISPIALSLFLFLGSEAHASRVIYNTLSLAELVRTSETIVVVEKAAGFAVIERKEANGCMSQRWPLRVRAVLKAGTSGIATGQEVPVIVNAIALNGCGLLKQSVMVSMVVNAYGAHGRDQPADPPQRFVAFLRKAGAGHELAAVNAIEDTAQVPRIVALIAP